MKAGRCQEVHMHIPSFERVHAMRGESEATCMENMFACAPRCGSARVSPRIAVATWEERITEED